MVAPGLRTMIAVFFLYRWFPSILQVHGDCALQLLGHAVLLVFGAPFACRKSNPAILVTHPPEDWAAKNTPCQHAIGAHP